MSTWGSNSSTNKFVDTYLRGFLDISGGDISVQNGNVYLYNTLDSTSISTGALRVSGGAGITKNLYVGGTIYGNLIGTIDATISSNDEIIANSTVNSSSTNSGSLQVRGGVGIVKDVYVGGNINILSGTASTSTSTGALQITGGAGIGGNLYVGGGLSVTGSASFTTIPTAPTSVDNSSNQLATTAYVRGAINNLVNGAGSALDTLYEIANAINNDPSYNSNILIAIGNRALDSTVVHLAGAETITGSKTFAADVSMNSMLRVVSGTASTSTSTGALQITGGAGIGGNVFVGGNLSVTGTAAFTGVPTAPTASAGTSTTQIATTAFVQTADAAVVHLAGAETITGGKTFSADVSMNSAHQQSVQKQ